MKRIIILTFFTVFSITAIAQPYKTAAGFRLGYFWGVSVKHFVSDKLAVEGIMTARWGGGTLIGLVQFEKEIPNAKGLYFLAGGGAHIGFYQKYRYYYRGNKHYHDHYYYAYEESNERIVSPGIDGIIGVEYKFAPIPFAISADFRPYIDFSPNAPGFLDAAISVRYTF